MGNQLLWRFRIRRWDAITPTKPHPSRNRQNLGNGVRRWGAYARTRQRRHALGLGTEPVWTDWSRLMAESQQSGAGGNCHYLGQCERRFRSNLGAGQQWHFVVGRQELLRRIGGWNNHAEIAI